MRIKQIIHLMAIILVCSALSSCASNDGRHVETDKRQQLAHIHYQLGIDALGKTGMLPKAFDELMQSDALQPNQAHVLDALAYAWLLRGDMKKSEAFYLRAIRHGGGASVHNNYANLLNAIKRYPEAEQAARQALDDPRYPNQDLAFINLGNALLGQKKFDAAIIAFQQAKLFSPDNTLAELRLAHAYFKHGKLQKAAALYKTLMHKQQGNRIAAEALVNIFEQQQRPDQARTVLNQFIQHSSSEADKVWAKQALEQLQRQ